MYYLFLIYLIIKLIILKLHVLIIYYINHYKIILKKYQEEKLILKYNMNVLNFEFILILF